MAIADCNCRKTKDCRFLRDRSAVGKNTHGVFLQMNVIKESKGFGKAHARIVRRTPQLLQALTSARMRRDNHGKIVFYGDCVKRLQQVSQSYGIINVFFAMSAH